MRELTFRGFLTQYVKQLSAEKTNSLYKLAAEADSSNPRLREPLLLYAVYTQKEKVLLQATKEPNLRTEYQRMVTLYTADMMTELFEQASPKLPAEYHKVWRSYQSRRNKGIDASEGQTLAGTKRCDQLPHLHRSETEPRQPKRLAKAW